MQEIEYRRPATAALPQSPRQTPPHTNHAFIREPITFISLHGVIPAIDLRARNPVPSAT